MKNTMLGEFKGLYGKSCTAYFSAAGRINIIGEHVDYCGGVALPMAIQLKSGVYAAKRSDSIIRISAASFPECVAFDISDMQSCKLPQHVSCQAGVISCLLKEGIEVCGCDLLYDIDIPFGAGLSSSAAIGVSTALALTKLSGVGLDGYTLARIAQRAENEYVGVSCGLMDQLASALGKKNCALFIDFSSEQCEHIPMDTGSCVFIAMNTNKPRMLRQSKYNERREQTAQAFSLLRQRLNIHYLAQASVPQIEQCKELLPETLYKRAYFVACECQRTREAVGLLRSGDMKGLGELMNASHMGLKELFEVTGRELDVITQSARSFEGCLGARMTGGGFGGCAIALVEKERKESFKKSVGSRYLSEIGYCADFYECEASDGLCFSVP